MPELLFEILSEEIPARMQQRAASELERQVNQRLLDAGFMPEGVKGFAGPRRLTVVATGLPGRQPDRREEKKGPRDSAPDKAVAGFLKSAGLTSLDQCEKREDKKGAYYVAVIEKKGKPTADLVAEFAPDIIRGFSWPKSMRWGASSGAESDLKWVRPIHSVLCAFDGEIVDFEIDGLRAGDETRGHRFMAPDVIQVRNFDDYADRLRNANVILETKERKDIIAEDAATLCKAQGLELVEDEGLLVEVSGLAEWPVTVIGTFDEKFLTLPDEVLTASMRGHQKYFSVRDPKTGRLANKFICVANIEAADGGKAMRAGYERVLTARLSDGWYLYNQDLKTPLADRVGELDKVTFFEGLGSVGDRSKRMAAIVNDLSKFFEFDTENARRAAYLAKADLVTGMVNEFPELQGAMGRYYALEQGEPAEIADAIRDHYKPVGQADGLPSGSTGAAVAIADKLDLLFGFFALGELPTGSKDPFALRRAALGVIRIVLEKQLRLRFSELTEGLLQLFRNQRGEDFGPGEVSKILPFFHDRLKVYFKDQGRRHDAIDAVRFGKHGALNDDLVLIAKKLHALEDFLKTDDGENLAAAYKRAANILKAEEKADGAVAALDGVKASLFAESQEKSLFAALADAEAKVEKAAAVEDFEGAMAALASLRAPVDAFFEKVTVNADDAKLRANRLSLLARLRAATEQVADFSKLEG